MGWWVQSRDGPGLWLAGTSAFVLMLVSGCASSGTLPPDTVPSPLATQRPLPTTTSTAVISQGTGRLRGTWTFDFELGSEVQAGQGDVWWEQVDSVRRYLVPQNGAKLASVGTVGFDYVSYPTLRRLTYSGLRVDGSNLQSNMLLPNSIIAVNTRHDHVAKVLIVAYGYDLTIRWATYS